MFLFHPILGHVLGLERFAYDGTAVNRLVGSFLGSAPSDQAAQDSTCAAQDPSLHKQVWSLD